MRAESPPRRMGAGVEVNDLRYLSAAAGAVNFARAAQALGLNSSTVSRRISRLEDKLGVTLFERGHFGIRLTPAGKEILVYVARVLDDIEALTAAGRCNGQGLVGRIRLGVRMPPVGEPLRSLLSEWRAVCPDVTLTLFEQNDDEIRVSLSERRIDAAVLPKHSRWPGATSTPVCAERVLAALPASHRLASIRSLTWADFRDEVILTQEWEGSHVGREFFASLVGSGMRFVAHSASKQSVLALVGAGFGVTLVSASQAEVSVPGVVFAPIAEHNAFLQMELAWMPESESAVLGRFIAFIRDCAQRESYSRTGRHLDEPNQSAVA